MNKYEIVIEYMKLEKGSPLGTSRLAPLIIMINKDEKIVKELLDENYIHYYNLWCFLDYGLQSLFDDYKIEYDLETIYKKVVYVLNTFNKLENKFEVNGEDFKKILKDNEV